jgi:hypothetical protein
VKISLFAHTDPSTHRRKSTPSLLACSPSLTSLTSLSLSLYRKIRVSAPIDFSVQPHSPSRSVRKRRRSKATTASRLDSSNRAENSTFLPLLPRQKVSSFATFRSNFVKSQPIINFLHIDPVAESCARKATMRSTLSLATPN